MRSRIAADIGFAEDLLWIYKIVRLGNEPSTPPASNGTCPARQNSTRAPSWMFLGDVTLPFHSPKSGLAMSVVNARLFIRPSTAKLCRLKRLKNSGAM
jgi:hypothetical protein